MLLGGYNCKTDFLTKRVTIIHFGVWAAATVYNPYLIITLIKKSVKQGLNK